MSTTLSTDIRLDVEHSSPTGHHFHARCDDAEQPNEGLRAINRRLVEQGQVYVRFNDGPTRLTLAGPADEIEAWARRLIDYVRGATASTCAHGLYVGQCREHSSEAAAS